MKLLVTGAWQNAKDYIPDMEEMGHEVTFMQYENEDLPCPAESIEGVICNGLFLYHKIEQFVNLHYIQLTSAGYDRLPMEYAKEKQITVFNAGGVYSKPMAEFALCGVLMLYKHMHQFMKQQEAHIWKKQRNLLELTDKKVLIFGCGSVGTECARRFTSFGAKVSGIDLHPSDNKYFEKIYGIEAADNLLKDADIIISALPLTDTTGHFFDKNRFMLMKRSAVFVNISRGAVVNPGALEQALSHNRIGGAVIDVFEEEPLNTESNIWDMPNVIITPHNSFVGDLNQERLWILIQKNLIRQRREMRDE